MQKQKSAKINDFSHHWHSTVILFALLNNMIDQCHALYLYNIKYSRRRAHVVNCYFFINLRMHTIASKMCFHKVIIGHFENIISGKLTGNKIKDSKKIATSKVNPK